MITPSLHKRFVILIPHIIMLILVLSMSVFFLWLKILLTILIVTSLTYYFRLHISNALDKSIHAIQQDSVNNWLIKTNGESEFNNLTSVNILPNSFISKYIIVLNFRDTAQSQYSVIIMKDSLQEDDYRRLYLKLKLSDGF